MAALSTHPELAIPLGQIREIIARCVALHANPTRFGIEFRNLIAALDLIVGNDVLTEYLDELDSDLGLNDEPEYKFVRVKGEAFDGDWVEVSPARSAYGLGGSAVVL